MSQQVILKQVIEKQLRTDLPYFKTGDTIEVFSKIFEKGKIRIQSFKGVILKITGSGITKSITIRKTLNNVAVEKTFPLHSPIIQKFTIHSRGKIRRAKLYFLRKLQGKKARIKQSIYRKSDSKS